MLYIYDVGYAQAGLLIDPMFTKQFSGASMECLLSIGYVYED